MANHFKRARRGDLVQSRHELPYLVSPIPPYTPGCITDVETPGRVFRVQFDGNRPRVARAEDLTMICRRFITKEDK